MLDKLLNKQSKEFKESKIKELKKELAKTDYQAIKYAEGWLSEEEFAPIKARRQALRNQINDLEK